MTSMPLVKQIRRFGPLLLRNRTSIAALTAAVLFVGFAITVPRFASADNLINMLRETAMLGILATGMTLIFVLGEIDISIGSVYGLLNVIMGILVVRLDWGPWPATALVVVLGAAKGVGTGAIVTRIGIPSFVITLAEMVAYRSSALLISGERPLVTNQAGSFYWASGGYIFGRLPNHTVWMLCVATAGAATLAKTKLGAHIYAIGGDRQASVSSGILVNRITVVCFTLMGALCGLTGALLFGWLHVAAPITGTGLEFSVIAAVILGGASLRGGRGSVLGSLIGASVIEMLSSALILAGLSQPWKEAATGALILAVSVLDWAGRELTVRTTLNDIDLTEHAEGILSGNGCEV